MKQKMLLSGLALFTCLSVSVAQVTITPSPKFIMTKYLKNEVSQYELSVNVKGKRVVRAILEETITLLPNKQQKKKRLLRVQKLLVQGRAVSVDSAIITLKDFKPIYHAGTNPKRNIRINYHYASGKVERSYFLKKKQLTHKIDQNTSTPYFDSNVYEMMLRILPLKPGLEAKFPAYAYESKEKHGVRWYNIPKVILGKYHQKVCYVITVKNNQGQQTNYWIDQFNRTLYKYEITMPNGRKIFFTKV